MEILLFLILAFLVFGAGFIVAGLQLAFIAVLFIGLFFGGLLLMLFLIGVALSPLVFLFGLFALAWLAGRYSRSRQIEPPQIEK